MEDQLRNELEEERARREAADAARQAADASNADLRALIQELQRQMQDLTAANEQRRQQEEAARLAALEQQRQAEQDAEQRRQQDEAARQAALDQQRQADDQAERRQQGQERARQANEAADAVAMVQLPGAEAAAAQFLAQHQVPAQQANLAAGGQPVAMLNGGPAMAWPPAVAYPVAVGGAGAAALPAPSASAYALPSTFNKLMEMTMKFLPEFSGDDKDYSIKYWVEQVALAVKAHNWTPEVTFVAARNKVTGEAAKYLERAGSISTWDQLRQTLVERYERTLSAADVHSRLATRPWKKSDPILAYFQKAEHLAMQVGMSTKDLQYYVARGVTKDSGIQLVLHNAATKKAFLDLLEDLERNVQVETDSKQQQSQRNGGSSDSKSEGNKQRACYVCLKRDHLANKCPLQEDGQICLNCWEKGHRKKDCKNPKRQRPKDFQKLDEQVDDDTEDEEDGVNKEHSPVSTA